jgi:ferredoxin
MLVIHPDECINCGVCEPECPAEAIFPDTKPNLAAGILERYFHPIRVRETKQQGGRPTCLL